MGEALGEFAKNGLLNIVGGCCGTTPDHLAAIVEAVREVAPRPVPENHNICMLSGVEPLKLNDVTGFVNVGERTNARLRPLQKINHGR